MLLLESVILKMISFSLSQTLHHLKNNQKIKKLLRSSQVQIFQMYLKIIEFVLKAWGTKIYTSEQTIQFKINKAVFKITEVKVLITFTRQKIWNKKMKTESKRKTTLFKLVCKVLKIYRWKVEILKKMNLIRPASNDYKRLRKNILEILA